MWFIFPNYFVLLFCLLLVVVLVVVLNTRAITNSLTIVHLLSLVFHALSFGEASICYFLACKIQNYPMDRQNKLKINIATTVLAIALYLCDSITDYVLGITYLRHNDPWHGWVTLTFVLLPGLFNSIYTATLHYSNNGMFIRKLSIPSALIYPFCLILHGQLSRLLVWIYFLNSKAMSLEVAKELIWVNRDMVFYPEIFIESIPQLYHQVYIIVVLNGDYTTLQVVTCFTSIMAASWGVLTLFDTFKNKLLAFEMSILWFTSRISAIALLASIDKSIPFIALPIHLVLVLPLWFYEIKKRPFQRTSNKFSQWQLIITDSFYSIVYAVCNTATPIVSAFYFPLSILFFVENTCCYVFAYNQGELYNRDVKNYRNETINITEWKYRDWFFGMCVTVTVLAFLQSVVIFILKYKNIIKGNFFNSQIINLTKAIRERKESQSRNSINLRIGSSGTLNTITGRTTRITSDTVV